MRRSKYGYLLLALLVITGLAGTITSTSITGKERKFAVNSLKDTRNEVFMGLKGLSRAQLNYKPAPTQWSIKEYTCRIAAAENQLWQLLQATLKQPANPESRSSITCTDEETMKAIENCAGSTKLAEAYTSGAYKPYNSIMEAVESFETIRAQHIKYIKGTTEDLRNHILKMPFGWIDCYQLCLVISALTDGLVQNIEKVKASKNFPSR